MGGADQRPPRGFIDCDTYQANQAKIAGNIRPAAHQPGTGAVREGCALLQGLATCGTCGRKLAVYYEGRHKATPGYYCTGTGNMVDGRGTRHLRAGGVAIDTAVTAAFLAALEPVALQACLHAARQLEQGHDAALAQHRRQVEQARYHAARAERRYQAVDPDNRLVARGLEAAWEKALTELAAAEAELARRQAARPATLTAAERAAILALGDDLQAVWDAPSTSDKDRKQLLRTLLEEVNITVHRDQDSGRADLVLRWKGGAITDLAIPIKRTPPRAWPRWPQPPAPGCGWSCTRPQPHRGTSRRLPRPPAARRPWRAAQAILPGPGTSGPAFPAVPDVEFPLFRAAARRLLDPAAFAHVDAIYLDTHARAGACAGCCAAAAPRPGSATAPPRPSSSSPSTRPAPGRSRPGCGLRKPGCSPGLFLELDLPAARAWRNSEPRLDDATVTRLRGLAAAAAVTLTRATGMRPDQLGALRCCDVGDGHAGL